MRRLLALIDRVSLVAAAVGAVALGLIAALIIADIVSVLLTRHSFTFVWEYAAFLMAAAFFLGLGHTLRAGGHVRVSLLLETLSPRAARFLDIVATVLALAFSAFLTFALVQFAWSSWTGGSVSFTPTATPLWIPQAVVAFGAALLTLQLAARLARLAAGEAPELPPSTDIPLFEH